MNPRLRTGIWLIAMGTAVFVVALGLFCVALGLDFQNEGWSGSGSVDGESANWSSMQLIVSSIGFTISIVLFFVGVQRVSSG